MEAFDFLQQVQQATPQAGQKMAGTQPNWQPGGLELVRNFDVNKQGDYSVRFVQRDGAGRDFEVYFGQNTPDNKLNLGLTGQNKGGKVLGNVLGTIAQFIRERPDITKLTFKARENDPNRVETYRSLLSRFLPKIAPGWTSAEQVGQRINRGMLDKFKTNKDPYTLFTLVNPNPDLRPSWQRT